LNDVARVQQAPEQEKPKSALWHAVGGVLTRKQPGDDAPPLADVASQLNMSLPQSASGWPSENEQRITFDDEFWITTVTETGTFHDVKSEDACRVFDSADPRNWNKYGPDFWHLSQQGDLLSDGNWRDVEEFIAEDPYKAKRRTPDQIWADKELPKQIYEAVGWNWNEQFESSIENVLDILQLSPALPRDAFARNAERPLHYEYRYRLRECRGAQLLDLFDQGGIDVDEGSFAIDYDEKKKSLSVTATKSIHYSRQPCSPPAYDYFLNLMSPALTAMLMTQLVVTGVRRVLDDDIPPPSIRGSFVPKGL
jgi:hypothetical protein